MPNNADFDETNEEFMVFLSESMADLVPRVFAPLIEISGKTHTRKCAAVANMEFIQIQRFLGVVEKCLGTFYTKHKGQNWKEEKLEEMAEPGLIYIWYEHEGAISCFLSMMMVLEPVGKTLYLYEIQVLPEFQNLHLGSGVMNNFHNFGTFLNSKSQDLSPGLYKHFSALATGLTVFSDNERAFNWYLKLGYNFAVDSPLDKRLRNGRIVKPSFYILSRPLS